MSSFDNRDNPAATNSLTNVCNELTSKKDIAQLVAQLPSAVEFIRKLYSKNIESSLSSSDLIAEIGYLHEIFGQSKVRSELFNLNNTCTNPKEKGFYIRCMLLDDPTYIISQIKISTESFGKRYLLNKQQKLMLRALSSLDEECLNSITNALFQNPFEIDLSSYTQKHTYSFIAKGLARAFGAEKVIESLQGIFKSSESFDLPFTYDAIANKPDPRAVIVELMIISSSPLMHSKLAAIKLVTDILSNIQSEIVDQENEVLQDLDLAFGFAAFAYEPSFPPSHINIYEAAQSLIEIDRKIAFNYFDHAALNELNSIDSRKVYLEMAVKADWLASIALLAEMSTETNSKLVDQAVLSMSCLPIFREEATAIISEQIEYDTLYSCVSLPLLALCANTDPKLYELLAEVANETSLLTAFTLISEKHDIVKLFATLNFHYILPWIIEDNLRGQNIRDLLNLASSKDKEGVITKKLTEFGSYSDENYNILLASLHK